jgi:hypothetical protein
MLPIGGRFMSWVRAFCRFVAFMIAAGRLYRSAKVGGICYGVSEDFGVPKVALVLGRDREAWRLSRWLFDSFPPAEVELQLRGQARK